MPPPEVKPPEQPPKPPPAKPNTLAAIVKIGTSVGGCSATVIGPRRPDGRYWVLSAAHCITRTGEQCSMLFRDGRHAACTVVNFDRKSDYCWMLTVSNSEEYPFALLADSTPPADTPIWHAGFGVHIPGNTETGKILGLTNDGTQVRMALSVSSGDSGGGIAITADGLVVSCVCCTVSGGGRTWTQGASTEAIHKGQVSLVSMEEWKPIAVPERRE